jgi:ADP-ribosylation factor related protein 1
LSWEDTLTLTPITPEYSILLLGLDNAGKTTLLSQIKALFTLHPDGDAEPSSTAGNTVPTVGQNVATISLPDMYLKIWDVGGQMSLRRLWQSYYKSAHAVIFVVDSTDLGGDADLSRVQSYFEGRRKSSIGGMEEVLAQQTPITPGGGLGGVAAGRLDECRRVLESVLEHEDAAGIPILVLANKQDREDCVEVVRIKEGFVRRVFEGEQGGMVRDSRVLPVSALKGTGVREAVEWVRSRVVWNKESRPPVMR